MSEVDVFVIAALIFMIAIPAAVIAIRRKLKADKALVNIHRDISQGRLRFVPGPFDEQPGTRMPEMEERKGK